MVEGSNIRFRHADLWYPHLVGIHARDLELCVYFGAVPTSVLCVVVLFCKGDIVVMTVCLVVVVDLPLLRVAVEGSDNPVSLEKPCQASLPPDQQGRHSLGRQP